MKNGYLANGLFSIGDRLVNSLISSSAQYTLDGVQLFVPQEQPFNDKSTYADSQTIAHGDVEALMESDFLIAVIDGVEIDSGVAAEIGMFYTTGRPIYALYSDTRQQGRDNEEKIKALIEDGTENQFMYRNLFVVGLIKDNGKIFSDIDSLINQLSEDFKGENND